MQLAHSFDIPHIVIHDEDPIDENLEGDTLKSARRTYGLNSEISKLSKTTNSKVIQLDPDFENVLGISKSQGKSKGKPLAALDHFQNIGSEDFDEKVVKLVNDIFGD